MLDLLPWFQCLRHGCHLNKFHAHIASYFKARTALFNGTLHCKETDYHQPIKLDGMNLNHKINSRYKTYFFCLDLHGFLLSSTKFYQKRVMNEKYESFNVNGWLMLGK